MAKSLKISIIAIIGIIDTVGIFDTIRISVIISVIAIIGNLLTSLFFLTIHKIFISFSIPMISKILLIPALYTFSVIVIVGMVVIIVIVYWICLFCLYSYNPLSSRSFLFPYLLSAFGNV